MPDTPSGSGDLAMSAELMSMLLPLHYFYEQDGIPLPEVGLLDGEEVPEPERSLLVHSRDMTSTLRNFHGAQITLEVAAAERSDDYLMRKVILRREDTGAPVEFGAIGIRLEKFEGPLREQVASGSAPLGALLEKYIIDYRSCPKGYFSTIADQTIANALDQEPGTLLYGRCNELTDAYGIAFADIVEVLPRSD